MRPGRSTWVASIMRRPAPEFASMPRCETCQSLATPSSALYWHIGEMTMRLSSERSASRSDENRAEAMGGQLSGESGLAVGQDEAGTASDLHGAEYRRKRTGATA